MLASSILVSLASLLVSLLGFANQIVLARLFGASNSMDAYLIATSIPMFVSGVISVGLSYSIVPALMRHKTDRDSYRRFSGLLLISLTLVAAVIAGLGYLAAPAQIAMLGSTFSSTATQEAITIARISWMTAGAMLVGAYLRAMHNAENRYLLATFSSMLPFVCMIFSGLAFASTYGPISVAWGMLAGFLLVIPLMLMHTLSGLNLSKACLKAWPEVAAYLSHAPLIILAMLCFTVFQSIDAYWAPQVGTGALASLSYSQRLLVALGNLIIAGPAAVILPRLAASYAEGRLEDLLNDTIRAVRMVFVFSVPVALGLSLLALPVVRLLFERGAFDQPATQGVAQLLPFMMTGMIAMLCVVIIFRALFAKRDLAGASMLGALTTAGYFCLSGILSQWMGATGIALAYALTWWLVLVLSLAVLSRGYIRLLFSKTNFVFTAKLACLGLATAGVLLIGALWIKAADAQGATLIIYLATVTACTAAFYCAVAIQIFKLGEVQLIYDFMASKTGSLTLRLGKTLAFKSK